MSPTFTDDDVGKPVETADGEVLGVVTAIDPGTAYVEPESELTDSTSAVLDWGDADEVVPLADAAVAGITDESIELEPDFSAESVAPASGDEDFAGADRSDADYDPGEPVESDATETATDGTNRGAGTGDLAGDATTDEPTTDDEYYDAPEGGPRVDPDAEMTEPGTGDRSGGTSPEELEDVEDEAGRELEVDPTELADEPATEIRPEEDVGDRGEPGDRSRERRLEDAADDDTASTDETTPEGERDADVGEMDEEANE